MHKLKSQGLTYVVQPLVINVSCLASWEAKKKKGSFGCMKNVCCGNRYKDEQRNLAEVRPVLFIRRIIEL